jgi:hypothetical protein
MHLIPDQIVLQIQDVRGMGLVGLGELQVVLIEWMVDTKSVKDVLCFDQAWSRDYSS